MALASRLLDSAEDVHLRRLLRELKAVPSKPPFHAALQLTAIEFPELEEGWSEPWRGVMQRFVEEARPLVDFQDGDDALAFARLLRFFSQGLGFAGDRDAYYSPMNSCLSEVISRRRGLPISLSVLAVTLGQHLGLNMFGVATPGHFLVGVNAGVQDLFADPFEGPAILNATDASLLISRKTDLPADFVRRLLVPATTQEIVVRMLRNMKSAFMSAGEQEKLLRALNWLLALVPNSAIDARDRGIILLRLGYFSQALRDLAPFLASRESEEEKTLVRSEIQRYRRQNARWN